ncbi:AAA family ATPase [Actinomadura graeca]|uniref:AAA family ATPase n=1 Tax=Actinomadura graeca TaxID=2750812 RepID=A0ABX8QRJ3_9ACTN|nr:AAA family ATPase [Actinomadura graeca]QXJ20377.1 AAA family ATPase [Actinomadura graeca]
MGVSRLPEHLEVLLTDEPVLDVYAEGPWRVPSGLYERLRERARELGGDPRALVLARPLSDFYDPGTGVAGAEQWSLLTFLLGASAVRGGSRGDVDYELLSGFLAAPEPAVRDPAAWFTQGGRWRPPGLWLPEPAGDDPGRRLAMYGLARACLDVFEGLEPLERRRRALVALHERRTGGPSPLERDAAVPHGLLEDAWAADAPEEVLDALPELAGPVGYLGWACAGLAAAHERLGAADGAPPLDGALARLLLAAGADDVPPQMSAAVGAALYENLRDRLAALRDGFEIGGWQRDVRGWLARGLVAGEADACRAWLDMAVRITGAVQGLPDAATSPDCRVPVRGFQLDLRRMFGRRRVANPLSRRLTAGRRAGGPGDAVAGGDPFGGILGPAALAGVLRDAVADAHRPVRLLICGPEGSGRRTAAAAVERVLAGDGRARDALRLSDQVFADLGVSDAVLWVQARVGECAAAGNVLVIRHLDAILGYDAAGPAVVEELRRAMADHPGLHVVALCRTGGEERLLAANPALVHGMRIARTADFGVQDHAELFRRAVGTGGGRVERRVARAAGALLVRTPAQLNMRNARLAGHLAEVCLQRARRRTGAPAGAGVEVTEADLPARPALPGAAAADPLAELAACVGIASVKREVRALVAEAKGARLRKEAGMTAHTRPRHLTFAGNPGTGKSTVAGVLGRLYAELGVLPSGHLVRAERADLVGAHAGDGAAKIRRVFERAAGGVLLIACADPLDPAASARDAEAADALAAAIESCPDDLVVVLSGPGSGHGGLLAARPALARLFPTTVRFPDLSDAELVTVFAARAAADRFLLAPGVLDRVRELVASGPPAARPGNARLMAALLERTVARQALRVMTGPDEDESLDMLVPDDVPASLAPVGRVEPADDPLAEIDRLVGLGAVKQEVGLLVAEARTERLRRDAGITAARPTRHMVFTGNPGTAKTTVARLLADVYARLGLLSSGHLVEVSRADLVAEFVGQTAPRVRAAVESALGGVLFVDEAYALHAPGADFGPEAVAELLRLMEEHRHDLVVIVAGYDREMREFLACNPGLASRFPRVLRFPDYTDDELTEIFAAMAADAGFRVPPGALAAVRRLLPRRGRGARFGNAREMRNLLDRAVAVQARRITAPGGAEDGPPDGEAVRTLRRADIEAAAEAAPAADGPGHYL